VNKLKEAKKLPIGIMVDADVREKLNIMVELDDRSQAKIISRLIRKSYEDGNYAKTIESRN